MLEAIVLAHLRYLENVERFLEGGPEPTLTSPTDCSLGRWLAGEGRAVYGPLLQEIEALHERFHALTAEAVAWSRGGKTVEASQKMNEAYALFGKIEHRLLSIAEVNGWIP